MLPLNQQDIRELMFRIDGDIDLTEWIDLLGYYFRGNEMILEYFDPETFNKEFRPRIEQYKNHAGTVDT